MKKLKPIPNDVFKRLVLLEIQSNNLDNLFMKSLLNIFFYMIIASLLIFKEIEPILILTAVVLMGCFIFLIIFMYTSFKIHKRMVQLFKQNKGSFLRKYCVRK